RATILLAIYLASIGDLPLSDDTNEPLGTVAHVLATCGLIDNMLCLLNVQVDSPNVDPYVTKQCAQFMASIFKSHTFCKHYAFTTLALLLRGVSRIIDPGSKITLDVDLLCFVEITCQIGILLYQEAQQIVGVADKQLSSLVDWLNHAMITKLFSPNQLCTVLPFFSVMANTAAASVLLSSPSSLSSFAQLLSSGSNDLNNKTANVITNLSVWGNLSECILNSGILFLLLDNTQPIHWASLINISHTQRHKHQLLIGFGSRLIDFWKKELFDESHQYVGTGQVAAGVFVHICSSHSAFLELLTDVINLAYHQLLTPSPPITLLATTLLLIKCLGIHPGKVKMYLTTTKKTKIRALCGAGVGMLEKSLQEKILSFIGSYLVFSSRRNMEALAVPDELKEFLKVDQNLEAASNMNEAQLNLLIASSIQELLSKVEG
ncbi:hypothetical protein HDU79_011711, partial [Rhizoclosmatium sp. JEL0117]